MTTRRPLSRMALNALVVALTVLGTFAGMILSAVPARAQPCDQTGSVITGNWVITNAQVCEGIVYTVDGSITINAGGSLTLSDGGLRFVQDSTHIYALTVNGGGILTLDNSIVTTEPRSLDAYLKLNVDIAGTLTMRNGAILKFPGTFDSSPGATINLDDSTITGHTTTEVQNWVGGGAADDNDDAPVLTWVSSTVTIYDSRIERLYENTSRGTPPAQAITTISGTTTLTAINSYFGVDFHDDVNTKHNEIRAFDTSRAFLVGVTIDQAQSDQISPSSWIPAFAPSPGGEGTFYLYRWLDAFVSDSSGVPVQGAGIWSQMSPFIQTAFYPDNGNLFCPGARILTYLGQACGTFNITGADGRAIIPLFTDQINTTTSPNAESFGNFELTARLTPHVDADTVAFDPYPIVTDTSNSRAVIFQFTGLTLPRPDLVATGATYAPATPLEGDNVRVDVTIRNQGAGGAGTFIVRFFDGSTSLGDQTAGPLGTGAQTVLSVFLNNAAGGTHTIRVLLDVADVVPETNEANNAATFSVPVTPIGPDLTVVVSFSPNPGFAENTVRVQATVINNGGGDAADFIVEFKQGTAAADPYASVLVPSLETQNSTLVAIDWIPSTPGDYTWYAIVDPDNRIPEPAPYREDDNTASATLTVVPAPNLQVFTQDLHTSDPYPFQGDTVTVLATVRNTGQAAAAASAVDFYVDETLLQRVAFPALGVGGAQQIATTLTWTATPCGYHTLRAVVDPANTVSEGSIYEADNSVTSTVQVYPAGVTTWSFTRSLTGVVIPSATSIEITGSVTITNGGIYVSQQSELCNRGLIKVTGAGRLILVNSTVSSNWPLTLYVADTAQLSATAGSALWLDAGTGPGTVRTEGASTVVVRDGTLDTDILATGLAASFRRTTFSGSSLYVNTAGESELWDATFNGVSTLQLRSDDGSQATPDFDIRNTTFDPVLTPQLRFAGRQWAQLTNVATSLPPGTDWWTGLVSQNAKVSRYWWLRVDAVDGTGTLLEGTNAAITIRRFDTVSLTYVNAPNPVADDIYFTSSGTWPVSAPLGHILYRAAAEDRFVSPSQQWANSTYQASASAVIGIPPLTYYPDANLSAILGGDTTITLVFSALTPELSINSVNVAHAGVPSVILPINRPLNVSAVVNNSGQISVRDVVVSFFATNVDVNNDGRMDNTKAAYVGGGLWIGDYTIALIPLRSTAIAWAAWNPTGVAETSRPLSVVVDAPLQNPADPGTFRELDDTNNIASVSVILFVWPDLSVTASDIRLQADAIEDNPTPIDVTVRNDGTADAVGASLVLSDDLGWTSSPVTFNLGRAASTTVRVLWVPAQAGLHDFTATVTSAASPIRNVDYNPVNNAATIAGVNVKTKPDIEILTADYPTTLPAVRGVAFNFTVLVHNRGDTLASGFTVAIFLDADTALLVGRTDGVAVGPQSTQNVIVRVTANAQGNHQLSIFADSHSLSDVLAGNGRIVESREDNNWANATVDLQPPLGDITISPLSTTPFTPGAVINIEGFVVDQNDNGLVGIPITVDLLDGQGNVIASTTDNSQTNGFWRVGLLIPQGIPDGTYTVRASTSGTQIPPATAQISVRTPGNFLTLVFLGLPVWLWLVIVIAVVAVALGVTLYFRVYGLGKMVECGECGSFIAETSTSCPKCGVEFEKDMAKCSNCQAWIPVDVKQCPECGVEFATGKVEMADYQEKMRMQYDEVVAKFRQESQRVLGRALTEREFQDWWRKQPTFVTFEDWLREEEEMRKMGSKPCPACGTLNSVTATVCHKCGTYLKEERRPPSGGAAPSGGMAPARPAAAAEPGAQPPAGAEAGTPPGEPIPKKVIRKPVAAPPIVQKKVVKKPAGEGEQEGGGGESSQQPPPEEEF